MRRALLLAGLLFCGAGAARAEGPSRRERLRLAGDGARLFSDGKFAAAADNYEMALAPGAGSKDAAKWRPALGRCYELLGNYQKALAAYQQAQEASPKSVDRMLDLARVYARVDLNDQAIEIYNRVLKKEKTRRDVSLILAQLYLKAGQVRLAHDQAGQYLKAEPRDVDAQLLMVQIERESGDLAGAAHRWEGALAQRPSAEGYFGLGLLWTRQDQYELGEGAFAKAQALGMDSAAFRFQRGLLAWRRGDTKAAGVFWNEALKLDPGHSLAKFFLALADRQAGADASALERMRQAQAETPSAYVRDLAGLFLQTVESAPSGAKKKDKN